MRLMVRELSLLQMAPGTDSACSRSMPTSTARSVRSSSQSISTRRRCGSRGSPELADPVGSLEVGEHQDVEQFRPGERAESIEPLAQLSFDVLQVHGLGR